MRNICLDARLVRSSGIGTYIQGLLKSLSSDKRFTLHLLHYGKDKELLPNSHLIEMKSPIYSIHEQFEWVKNIPVCDLFFAPHFNIPILPIRAKRRMTTIHDVFHLSHFSKLNFSQKIYSKIMYNSASFLSDQVVTVSEFSKREIEKYLRWTPKKLDVILNGVDIKQTRASLDAVQKKYRLPKKFILAVGNVKPHKNLKSLFAAYDEDIVVVGKNSGFITNDHLETSKKVLFVGEVENSEIPAFYQLASLFVFPSLYEGFGYPPLEAMAYGCPVVASNIGALQEVCGDACIFVNPHDVSSIRNGIELGLKNREELILKGFLHVKKYDLQSRVKELIDLIYENCSKNCSYS